MTYQSLSDIIMRLCEKSRLPREKMEQFEVAVVRHSLHEPMEKVMLAGLLPVNQHGAKPLIMACCQTMRGIILTDTERIDCLDIKQMPDWDKAFYDFGKHLGIDHDQLKTMLTEILLKKED